MSYILDALKKAETKRKEEQVTPLHLTQPLPKAGRTGSTHPRPWLVVAAALLFALPPALLYLHKNHSTMLSGTMPQHSEAKVEQHTIPLSTEPGGTEQQVMPADSITGTDMPAKVADVPELRPTGTKVAFTPQSAAHEEVIVEPAPLVLVRQTALVQQPQQAQRILLPALEEMDISFRQSLPELHLAGHVYSKDPGLRMILINHRVFREKESINKDLVLDEITPEGVILRAGEIRFRMKGY